MPLLVLTTIGCGGGGGLLATVPPPVEFAGARINGLIELPAAGTYTGTLLVEHVTLKYVASESRWTTIDVSVVDPSTAAVAVVGADGTILLRRSDETAALFTGTLKATPSTNGGAGSTTATLESFDGTLALYPYFLNGTPHVLTLTPHTAAEYRTRTDVSFDRYTFELTAP